MDESRMREALLGCMLGTAAGDMAGLPFENLSGPTVRRIAKLPLEPSLFFGRGLISDDTEQTFLAASAMAISGSNAPLFAKLLAAKLRWWIAALPPGIGMATIKSCGKLWLGRSPATSGVFSAGNGSAMRSSVIGVAMCSNPAALAAMVRASTAITHSDPKAFEASLLVACAAAAAALGGPMQPRAALDSIHALLRRSGAGKGKSIRWMLAKIEEGLASDASFADMARLVGSTSGGVTGYALHTVPVAILCWLRVPSDARSAITEAILSGGDTDSVAAIAGALVGAGAGPSSIPSTWLDLTWEPSPPRRQAEVLASALSKSLSGARLPEPGRSIRMREALNALAILPRNLGALCILLIGAVRRSAKACWTLALSRRAPGLGP